MKLRNRNFNGNINGQCVTSEEKNHLKNDHSDNWLNTERVTESCYGCFVLLIGTILEMSPYRRKRAAESELIFRVVRLSREAVR